MKTTTKPLALAPAVVVAACALVGVGAGTASALLAPGTPAKDVHIGADDDTTANPLIQPPGVTARQDMDGADVLFGRDNDDLLIGNRGSDALLGGAGSDILVGGPDRGATPSSDVLDGDVGDDVGVWSPGDGNDAFAAFDGTDTMILGVLATAPDGTVPLTRKLGRQVPSVAVDGLPRYGCDLVAVPASAHFGAQYLVRFRIDGAVANTVRLKDVERVICPSPAAGHARVATLTAAYPSFTDVPLAGLTGLTGAIVTPKG